MNKQEAIREMNKAFPPEGFTALSTLVLYSGDIIDLKSKLTSIINQIEPEKVVIPRFVAEWIETYRKQGKTLYMAMDAVHYSNHPCRDWFKSNQETFAHAWLNGYSVIKEPLYWVNVPNGDRIDLKLCKTPKNEIVLDSFSCSKLIDHKLKLTKHEIENAGFGWVFDCGFAKEVKE